jgi:benzodiazapine receptor
MKSPDSTAAPRFATLIDIARLIACLALCFGVAAGGALFTTSETRSEWYAQLQKPLITPPDWLFAPVWTILYFLMAVSAFLVWRKGLNSLRVGSALIIFLIQLALNAAWTPLFFRFHLIGWALIDVGALLAVIVATFLAFLPISKPAAALLIPYIVWVAFATALNARLYQLNP